MGWVYETALVSIREKTWSNRGFLMGPICPIYGAGALLFILVGTGRPLWLTFLLCMAGSAVLEYGTAYALERLFHASWWDYSDMPLNLNGYICLPASLFFGAAGTVVSHFVHPLVAVPVSYLPSPAVNVAALLLVGVTSADLTLTVSSLSDFVVKVKSFETHVNRVIGEKYDELESSVSGRIANVRALSLSSAMKDSIIEQELQKANLRLTRMQADAVRKIRRFRDVNAPSAERMRIRNVMLRLAEKTRRAPSDGKGV